MPFPDGTGMAAETFTSSQAANAAAMGGATLPQHATEMPPAEAAPNADVEAMGLNMEMPTFGRPPEAVDHRASASQMPPHLARPASAFIPEPVDSDLGVGVAATALMPDGQVNLAAGVGKSVPATATADPPGEEQGVWSSRPEVHLSATATDPTPKWDGGDKSREAAQNLADDHLKIKCPKCDHVQQIKGSKKCSNCGHDLKDAVKAKMANLSVTGTADQIAELMDLEEVSELLEPPPDDPVHLAVIFQQQEGMNLAVEKEPGGLVQKVVCVTGTLALSPGPGQIDLEEPLSLTPDMFQSIKEGFDEGVFPHVTVPETHANSSLENTGYVRTLDIKGAHDPTLPPEIAEHYKGWPADTQLMLAGIEFTEPTVREKALNGSIPDTSIGMKFGYRNKRTGKRYPVSLEHVALTPIPWVDGLTPFGNTLLSGQPFDAEEVEGEFDGVYVDVELSADGKPKKKDDAKPDDKPDDKPKDGEDPEDKADDGADESTEDDANTDPQFGAIDEPAHIADELVAHPQHPKKDEHKAHIVENAKRLGLEHMLPSHWQKDLKDEQPPNPDDPVHQDNPPEDDKKKKPPKSGKLAAPVNADKRREYASKGIAMSDGSFPIPDEKHLKSAIKLAGNASDSAKARAHIKKRAKALNCEHLIPDTWKSGDLSATAEADADAEVTGDILSSEGGDDSLPPMAKTVEELLAEQQARNEALAAQIEDLTGQLQTTQLSATQTAEQLWRANVDAEVALLQKPVEQGGRGLTPAVAERVREIKLAAFNAETDDSGQLNLSVTTEVEEDGEKKSVEKKLDVAGIIDHLTAAIPAADTNNEVTRLVGLSAAVDAHNASKTSDEANARKKYEEWEKGAHPERFDNDGKRVGAAA